MILEESHHAQLASVQHGSSWMDKLSLDRFTKWSKSCQHQISISPAIIRYFIRYFIRYPHMWLQIHQISGRTQSDHPSCGKKAQLRQRFLRYGISARHVLHSDAAGRHLWMGHNSHALSPRKRFCPSKWDDRSDESLNLRSENLLYPMLAYLASTSSQLFFDWNPILPSIWVCNVLMGWLTS